MTIPWQDVYEDPVETAWLMRPRSKASEYNNPRHSVYIRSLWPEINGGHGGIDLPRLKRRGQGVEVKESHTKRNAVNLKPDDYVRKQYILGYFHVSKYFYLCPMVLLPEPVSNRSITEALFSNICLEHGGVSAVTTSEDVIKQRVKMIRTMGRFA